MVWDAPTDGGSGGGSGNDDGDHSNSDGGGGKGGSKLPTTQDELDAIIETRLARDRSKTRKDIEKQVRDELKAESDKANLTEIERLKKDKEDADTKVSDAEKRSNQRIVAADARVIASELGVKADRIPYLLKLVDLSEVTVGEDGEPDSTATRSAIEKILKAMPELKGASDGKGGNDIKGNGGGDDGPLTREKILAMAPEERTRRMPEIKKFYEALSK